MKDKISIGLFSTKTSNKISLSCEISLKKCNSTNINEIKPGIYELILYINNDKSNLKSDSFIIYGKTTPLICFLKLIF